MATARQLRLERLLASAASAGECGCSVLTLITLFNAFYEAHGPPATLKAPRSEASTGAPTPTASADEDRDTDLTTALNPAVIEVDADNDVAICIDAVHATQPAALAGARGALWRSLARTRKRVYAVARRATAALGCACLVQRPAKSNAPLTSHFREVAAEDAPMAAVLRAAVEIERDHARALVKSEVKLAMLRADARANDHTWQTYHQLCAIVRGPSAEEHPEDDHEASVWV